MRRFGIVVTFDERYEFVKLYDILRDCLLYTSDAADEWLRVDLGGRRLIKNPPLDLLTLDSP